MGGGKIGCLWRGSDLAAGPQHVTPEGGEIWRHLGGGVIKFQDLSGCRVSAHGKRQGVISACGDII